MHVPDGFLDIPTSIATGVASAAVVAYSLRRARTEISDATAPMAGLVAAFIFAVQMINFPVGIGTSGHLMGGALAAVLIGPWTAMIALAVVVAVQALLFADGGLSALGSNVLLIGIVTVVVGYAVAKLVVSVLPKRPASAVPAAAVGALLSVPATAMVFVGLYAVGGASALDLGQLTAVMLTWHVLIGIGEALITGLTVAAVVAARPDLVHLTRGYRRSLLLTDADGTSREVETTRAAPPARRLSTKALAVAGAVTLLIAGVVSGFASANPDGLEYAAEQVGFLDTAQDSAAAGSPLGDYSVLGIDNPFLSTGLAGVLGVAVTMLIAYTIYRFATRRAPADPARETEKV